MFNVHRKKGLYILKSLTIYYDKLILVFKPTSEIELERLDVLGNLKLNENNS